MSDATSTALLYGLKRVIWLCCNRHDVKQTEPVILHGRNPHELPRKNIGTIILGNQFAAVTGPDGGLTTVNRRQRHLSTNDPDVDYIDIQQHVADQERNNTGTTLEHLCSYNEVSL